MPAKRINVLGLMDCMKGTRHHIDHKRMGAANCRWQTRKNVSVFLWWSLLFGCLCGRARVGRQLSCIGRKREPEKEGSGYVAIKRVAGTEECSGPGLVELRVSEWRWVTVYEDVGDTALGDTWFNIHNLRTLHLYTRGSIYITYERYT